MKKFFFTFVCLVAVAVAPVWAGLSERLTWVDNIPGLKVIKYEESMRKVEKDYLATNAEKEYQAIVDGLKKNGWRVVKTEIEDGLTNMPEITAVKDGMKFELEVDKDMRADGREVCKFEVSLKSYK
ncbi:MAG: hypothetical protein ACI376_06260 [Candidatus Bruticola sp.]